MGFTKITNVSLTELFVQQIENMILSGELAVGEQLPPARELSVRMGVSRPVISAGLIELEKLGFIEIRPRQGAFVSDYRRKGTVETLVAVMRYNGGAMRDNEVTSLLQVRNSLESLCMELVIQNATDRELASVAPLLQAIEEAKLPEDAADAIYAFHHELAALSGNMLLPLLYHSFKPESLYLWTISFKKEGKQKLCDAKVRLYQALLNRDTQEAIRLTQQRVSAPMTELSAYTAYHKPDSQLP